VGCTARRSALALPLSGLAALRLTVPFVTPLERAARRGSSAMRRGDPPATLPVSSGLRFEWTWSTSPLRRLAARQPPYDAMLAGTALDGDGPPLAVLCRASLDASTWPLGARGGGSDLGAQRRDMFAAALWRGRFRGRAARPLIPLDLTNACIRATIGSAVSWSLWP
jgi:hypothetical protein